MIGIAGPWWRGGGLAWPARSFFPCGRMRFFDTVSLCRGPLADRHLAALRHQSIKAADRREENYLTYFQHSGVKSALRRLPDVVLGDLRSIPRHSTTPPFVAFLSHLTAVLPRRLKS